MTHLAAFHFSPHGVHDDETCPDASPAESHPVRDIDFAGNRLGRNAQIADPKKAGAEKQALHLGDDNLPGLGFIQQGF
jgi:hypothetical protein